MNITPDSLIDLMPIVADRGWHLEGDCIRDSKGCCPVCAFVNEISHQDEISWSLAAHTAFSSLNTGVDDGTVVAIVNAADNYATGNHPLLRERLMLALGMRP